MGRIVIGRCPFGGAIAERLVLDYVVRIGHQRISLWDSRWQCGSWSVLRRCSHILVIWSRSIWKACLHNARDRSWFGSGGTRFFVLRPCRWLFLSGRSSGACYVCFPIAKLLSIFPSHRTNSFAPTWRTVRSKWAFLTWASERLAQKRDLDGLVVNHFSRFLTILWRVQLRGELLMVECLPKPVAKALELISAFRWRHVSWRWFVCPLCSYESSLTRRAHNIQRLNIPWIV